MTFGILKPAAGLIVAVIACNVANAETVDIYDGYGQDVPSLTLYFSGLGYTVNNVGSSFSSLAGANLAILSYPIDLDASQITTIDNYVIGGGNLIINSDGQGLEDGQNAVNSILTSLGSSIVNVDGAYDPGYQYTTNIVGGPYTNGVTTIGYGYTSTLTGGNPVAYGNSGQLFIAEQSIGSGRVMAIADIDVADSYVFGNLSDSNATLYCNFGGLSCAAGGVGGIPEPSTWTIMLIGFAGLGAAIRSRRKLVSGTA